MARLTKKEKQAMIAEMEAKEKESKKLPTDKDKEAKKFVSPLISEPIDEKEYAKRKVKDIGDIPEHKIKQEEIDVDALANEVTPQSIVSEEKQDEKEPKSKKTNKAQEPIKDIYNEPPPSANVFGATPSEQSQSAEYLADIIIDAYEKIHQLTGVWLKYDKDKLTRKSYKGKFDMRILNMQISEEVDPYTGEKEVVTIWNLMEGFNKNVDVTLVVSDDFKEKIRPLLINFLEEKGVGLTNNQNLLIQVAMDAGQKIIALGQQKLMINNVIKDAKYFLEKQQHTPPPPPPPAPKPSEETSTPPPHEVKVEKNPETETVEEIIEEISNREEVEPEEESPEEIQTTIDANEGEK